MLVVVLALAVVGLIGASVATVMSSMRARDEAASIDPPRERGGRDKVEVIPPARPERPRDRPGPNRTRPTIGRPTDVSKLAKQVARIRGLPLKGDLRSRLVGGNALGDKVSELAFSEMDPAETRANQRLLVALRLADPEIKLQSVMENLYREQILGLYVPKERTLYVRSEGGGSPAERITTAHEITHALQDRAFDLVAQQDAVEDDAEAGLALLSLIEGDAVLTQQLWASRHLSQEDQREAIAGSASGSEALDEAPEYLRASLFFPYLHGGTFVADLYRAGGSEAVDAAFRDPPTTTEQILHPEKYRAGEGSVRVRVATRPGGDWKPSTTYEFGEFDLAQQLGVLGDAEAQEAGAGWGGGQIRSWTRGDETLVAASLAFDTEEDSEQVCAALPQWYVEVADGQETGDGAFRGDRDFMAVRCEGGRVHFALAPTAGLARTAAGYPAGA